MKHFASSQFWRAYQKLPTEIQRLADRSYRRLKSNPNHPSLHFKKIGTYWSARVGLHYRALAVEAEADLVWFLDWFARRLRPPHRRCDRSQALAANEASQGEDSDSYPQADAWLNV